ncbi:uncharacterized protein C8Q71DRAFT_195789 [Rhodofomes roseus]|uniref:Tim44-like domain-containing protein n=1 Tax=Rhodofomes roseus TaxID=34475 RepID=A0ABQ8K7M4_9APHY|nr:uncharacterized protein C8Q71DRAFT_195789 [Rhodofomes roseus]KAH9833261.1 hypothetical protein C8Q71DRAFT_195789 [Rhodofomes roseus]
MSSHFARRCFSAASRRPNLLSARCTENPRLLGALVRSPCRRSYAAKWVKDTKDPDELSSDEIIQRLEMVKLMEKQLPYDPWAQSVQTFDLTIPSLLSKKKDAALSDHLQSLGATFRNWARNALSMRMMAGDKGFPGIAKTSPWSLQIFKAQSTSDSAWVAPLRRLALDTYTRINRAVAEHDERAIKELSIGDMRTHYLKLVRQQDPTRRYMWKLVGERTPCRILSVRTTPAHLGKVVPNNGSRLLTQVLVRFDTIQSLAVYTRKGSIVHKQDPKPVVEFLVLQKRMWYDSPWVIRDVLYEGLENHEKSLSA